MEPVTIRALAFGCLLLPAGCAVSAKTAADRPNILWLTVEDMSPNLGCWGDAYARTPNIDRLSAESIRYTNVFATAPVCSPARSCLITGVYATTLGTQRLRSRFPIPDSIRGFPAYLRDAGYHCTNNVKTDYNTSAEERLIRESWDESSEKAHWRGRRSGRPFFAVFNDMTTHQSRSMVWPYAQFQKEVQSRLEPGEIHDPARAPVPPYYPDTPVVRRTIARYYDCITVMDKNVGRILRELEEDGLAGDTIVFFFSDHGAGLPRHKRMLYDSGMRAPLLVRFPPRWRHLAPAAPGATVERLVSFVDFPPAVLGLAGLPAPGHMQGAGFFGPVARTHVYGARDRVDEAHDLARSVRDARHLYIRNYMPEVPAGQPSAYCDLGEIRHEILRLAAEGKLPEPAMAYALRRRPTEELYDTLEDPHQIRNLATDPKHTALLDRMRRLHREWIRDSRDTGFLPETEASARGGAPYEQRYDHGRIAEAASRTGQIELLGDPDAAVRYWAVKGLESLEPLRRMLGDPSAAVRIAAAAALAHHGEVERALEVLVRELEGGDLEACRAIELLGERARAALPAMRALAERVKDGPDDRAMFLRFSSGAFLSKLGR